MQVEKLADKNCCKEHVTISFIVHGYIFAFYMGSLLLLHTFIMYCWFHFPSQVFPNKGMNTKYKIQIHWDAFLNDQFGTL